MNYTFLKNYTIFTNSTDKVKDYGQSYTFVIGSVLLSCMIFVPNGLILYLYHRVNRIRNFSNFLLLNLAVADMCMGVVVIPIMLLSYLLPHSEAAAPFYFFVHMLTSTFLYIVVFNMTLVVLERYFHLCHPYTYESIHTCSHRKQLCLIPWVIVAIISVIPIAWHVPRFVGSPINEKRIAQKDLLFTISSSVACFVLPTLVIIWALASMCMTVFRVVKNDITETKKQKNKRSVKTIIIFFIMFVTMIICWMPWSVIRVLVDLQVKIPLTDTHMEIIFFLRCCSSIVNPVVYTAIKQDFRFALKGLLRCRKYGSSSVSSRISRCNMSLSNQSKNEAIRDGAKISLSTSNDQAHRMLLKQQKV